jgi:hypothetical protein
VIAVVFVLCSATTTEVKANMPQETSKLSGPSFLAMLKRIIGDGDLRNIDRLSKVLNAKISLEAGYIEDNDSKRRLARVNVVPDTEMQPFVPPLFRFSFDIQDSVPFAGSNARTIATMNFTALPAIGCVTREDLLHEFGKIESETWGTPGAGSVVSFPVGEGAGYRTELSANIRQGELCAAVITVWQVSK